MLEKGINSNEHKWSILVDFKSNIVIRELNKIIL